MRTCIAACDSLRLVLVVIIAYLIGSIPFGYLIVRATGRGDVRETGSGGTGATNVSRRAGKAAGVFTLILDLLKGAIAIIIAKSMLNPDATDWWIAAAAIAVIVGHIFPVWLAFRGGKGVATGAGVFLALAPMSVLCAGVIFVACCLVEKDGLVRIDRGRSDNPGVFLVQQRLQHRCLVASLVCACLIVFAHRGKHRENLERH